MTDHYYAQSPGVKHDRHKLQVNIRGIDFTFMTDAGVFSKSGIDYGSRVLLDALELNGNERILDVGCGYGPIGLTAAKLAPQGHVTMVDINERAVALSRENAVRNGVSHVEVLQSDALAAVADRRYDVILTNPPIRAGKAVVHRIFEESWSCLNPGGSLWVVIQKKQGAASAEDKLESLFEEVSEVTKDKGYRIYRAIRGER
ncbi:class I SAM-dependent methyltransferase [Paenibacillus sp. GCM10023252]|uniref:class I SAM-dependent methyltransferase n=1 Tax=Paenibacillus sp. GCM10023252 TaxID=3252649 RepID=UPI003609A44C